MPIENVVQFVPRAASAAAPTVVRMVGTVAAGAEAAAPLVVNAATGVAIEGAAAVSAVEQAALLARGTQTASTLVRVGNAVRVAAAGGAVLVTLPAWAWIAAGGCAALALLWYWNHDGVDPDSDAASDLHPDLNRDSPMHRITDLDPRIAIQVINGRDLSTDDDPLPPAAPPQVVPIKHVSTEPVVIVRQSVPQLAEERINGTTGDVAPESGRFSGLRPGMRTLAPGGFASEVGERNQSRLNDALPLEIFLGESKRKRERQKAEQAAREAAVAAGNAQASPPAQDPLRFGGVSFTPPTPSLTPGQQQFMDEIRREMLVYLKTPENDAERAVLANREVHGAFMEDPSDLHLGFGYYLFATDGFRTRFAAAERSEDDARLFAYLTHASAALDARLADSLVGQGMSPVSVPVYILRQVADQQPHQGSGPQAIQSVNWRTGQIVPPGQFQSLGYAPASPAATRMLLERANPTLTPEMVTWIQANLWTIKKVFKVPDKQGFIEATEHAGGVFYHTREQPPRALPIIRGYISQRFLADIDSVDPAVYTRVYTEIIGALQEISRYAANIGGIDSSCDRLIRLIEQIRARGWDQ